MEINISAQAFNGNVISPKIEILPIGLVKINSQDRINKNIKPLSEAVYRDVEKIVISLLNDFYDNLGIHSIDFKISSRDIENLQRNNITLHKIQLAAAVSALALNLLLEYIGGDPKDIRITEIKSIKDAITYLSDRFEKDFKSRKSDFVEKVLDASGKRDENLRRARNYYEEREYQKAIDILKGVDAEKLSPLEFAEYDTLNFAVWLKLHQKMEEHEENEKIFRRLLEIHKNDLDAITELYFTYLSYLEENRLRLSEILKEFENRYSIGDLPVQFRVKYYTLKGKALYLRGEFLEALRLFTLAADEIDENNDRDLGQLYNSAANCFTDNLFYEEAENIALKALKIRETKSYPEIAETYGLLGGLFFKRSDFKQAEKYFKLQLNAVQKYYPTQSDVNRIYNYLAKAAIMRGDFGKAEDYLKQALEAEDKHGFSNSIMILLLLKEKKYDELEMRFRETFLLPEKIKQYDNFPLAWAYTYRAISFFEQKQDKEAIKQLINAVNFFIDDLYFLEAAYVSLYLYVYKLSKSKIRIFRKLEPPHKIITQFNEYCEKHVNIADDFFEKISGERRGAAVNRLREFQKFYNSVDDSNFNSETIVKKMDEFSLF